MNRRSFMFLLVISILLFSSSLWGEDVSTLLEKAIYAEETKGDLNEAMRIYQKIIDENAGNSAKIAEAYYRLGTCYQKTGDDSKAIDIFKKLLARFRKQEEIASAAKNQLAKLNALDEEQQINKPLELGRVPWEAGETCQYNVKTPAGVSAGKVFHSVKELSKDGNDLWRTEDTIAIPMYDSQIYLRSDALKEGLNPVSSIMIKRGMAAMSSDYSALYKKDHIQFTNAEKDKKDIPVGDIAYDSQQNWEIIRRLPLAENYSTSFNAFDLQSGKIMNIQLNITGKEIVTVPAGTFECYSLKLDYDSIIKAKMWVSTDVNKYITKLDGKGYTIELEKITHVTVEEPVLFKDSGFGISMSAPHGWHFVKSSRNEPFKMLLEILSPELKAVLVLVVAPHYGTLSSLQDINNASEKILAQVYKNYIRRPESWVYRNIGGLPSSTFVADYDSDNKKMVQYRTDILDKQEVSVFELHVEKEKYNEIKTDIDSIVQSFKWNKNAQSNKFSAEQNQQQPYVVGAGVKAPIVLFQPLPPYTAKAQMFRIEGAVLLQCIIRKDGAVDGIKVLRGLGYGLDESAIETIATKWRFQPGTYKDEPVDVSISIEVSFRLSEKSKERGWLNEYPLRTQIISAKWQKDSSGNMAGSGTGNLWTNGIPRGFVYEGSCSAMFRQYDDFPAKWIESESRIEIIPGIEALTTKTGCELSVTMKDNASTLGEAQPETADTPIQR
jgi:TonB family protein